MQLAKIEKCLFRAITMFDLLTFQNIAVSTSRAKLLSKHTIVILTPKPFAFLLDALMVCLPFDMLMIITSYSGLLQNHRTWIPTPYHISSGERLVDNDTLRKAPPLLSVDLERQVLPAKKIKKKKMRRYRTLTEGYRSIYRVKKPVSNCIIL